MSDEARDEAIERVDGNADPDWKDAAYDAALRVATRSDRLTSDDVWDELVKGPDVATHEPRAMGPVMLRLRKDGVIHPTDIFVKSSSPRGHGHPARVWESRITVVSHA